MPEMKISPNTDLPNPAVPGRSQGPSPQPDPPTKPSPPSEKK